MINSQIKRLARQLEDHLDAGRRVEAWHLLHELLPVEAAAVGAHLQAHGPMPGHWRMLQRLSHMQQPPKPRKGRKIDWDNWHSQAMQAAAVAEELGKMCPNCWRFVESPGHLLVHDDLTCSNPPRRRPKRLEKAP